MSPKIRVPTKIRKQNSMTFPWFFHDWLAFFHDSHSHMASDMVIMGVSQHARQSQTRKLPHSPQPWEEAIPWLFHDFLGNFHIPRLFHDFPWQKFFPGFSHDRGNPVKCFNTQNAKICTQKLVVTWKSLNLIPAKNLLLYSNHRLCLMSYHQN